MPRRLRRPPVPGTVTSIGPPSLREQVPELRGAAVAEHRALATCERSRQPSPSLLNAAWPTAYTPRWTRCSRPASHSTRHALARSTPAAISWATVDHSVLPSREPRDRPIAQWRVSDAYGPKSARSPGCPLTCPFRPPPGPPRAYDPALMPAIPSVSAQFSVTVRVELDARQEPLGKLTAADRRGGRGASGRGPRARRGQRGQAGARVHDRRPRPGALGGDPASDRVDARRAGARLRRPHAADAPRRQDRAAQQVPAEDPRRPLDGLHARRRPRLPGDRRRPLEGVRVHDQAQHRRRRLRRQRGARPRRHRPRGRDAGDGGQGDAVQGVRRRRRLPDLPRHPRPGPDRRAR